MSKTIVQFGFKHLDLDKLRGLPVLDCRVIDNPFKRGMADSVAIATVRANPMFESVVQQGLQLIAKHDKVFIGCLWGKHRSGAVAQEISARTGAIIKHLNYT